MDLKNFFWATTIEAIQVTNIPLGQGNLKKKACVSIEPSTPIVINCSVMLDTPLTEKD